MDQQNNECNKCDNTDNPDNLANCNKCNDKYCPKCINSETGTCAFCEYSYISHGICSNCQKNDTTIYECNRCETSNCKDCCQKEDEDNWQEKDNDDIFTCQKCYDDLNAVTKIGQCCKDIDVQLYRCEVCHTFHCQKCMLNDEWTARCKDGIFTCNYCYRIHSRIMDMM